tara:strand:+ start:50 stop:262 length:213 start_codon:yes stop_codon:yes gene_type:complete
MAVWQLPLTSFELHCRRGWERRWEIWLAVSMLKLASVFGSPRMIRELLKRFGIWPSTKVGFSPWCLRSLA